MPSNTKINEIRPQEGPQIKFLSTPADICIYGGAAGGGKTYALLLENLRHINNPEFRAITFRRNANQINAPGGLWDTANSIYPFVGGLPKKSPKYHFEFPSKAVLTFAHLERYTDALSYQGSQIPLINFDEVTHFEESVFWYILSRNRSTSGVKPYVRATTNPDPDSFVAKLIEWWIDQDTGYAIQERSGILKYFVRIEGELIWGSTKEELIKQGIVPEHIKSLTFIASSLYDNRILTKADPGYIATLKALPLVEQERLLNGNWKIRPAAGLFFKRSQVTDWLDEVPSDVVMWIRSWDLAATDTKTATKNTAYTAGLMIGKRKNGKYVIADAVKARESADGVRKMILTTARMDYEKYKTKKIRLPQDPGQAGKDQAESYAKLLSGFSVTFERETGSKETRAEPLAAQWQAGNVQIVKGSWNEMLITEYEGFPESAIKDLVDAGAGGFNVIEKKNVSIAIPAQRSGLMKDSYWR